MMGAVRGAGVPYLSSACWRFGSAVFDEAKWTLTVDGRRVAIEGESLELLRELVHREGAVATKTELLDAVWPDVSVVEGSLPTAVARLRRAQDDQPTRAEPPARDPPHRMSWSRGVLAAGLIAAVAATALWLQRPAPAAAGARSTAVTTQEIQLAARRLDLVWIVALLARGYDPNMVGAQRNTVLNTVLERCEWNPGNEQRVLMAARALIDPGAKVDQRNYWGDTAYSIASARRYCGPDHHATGLMRLWCSDGAGGVRPSCLAHYVHQGEPPAPETAYRQGCPDRRV